MIEIMVKLRNGSELKIDKAREITNKDGFIIIEKINEDKTVISNKVIEVIEIKKL